MKPIFFVLLFTATFGLAQVHHGLYAETYLVRHDFHESFFSLNYELTFQGSKVRHIRVGVIPEYESPQSYMFSIPITATRQFFPGGRHHLEAGIGFIFRAEHFESDYNDSDQVWFYDVPAFMFPLMYRYSWESGLFFRGGINLMVSWPTLPAPAFSLGYQF